MAPESCDLYQAEKNNCCTPVRKLFKFLLHKRKSNVETIWLFKGFTITKKNSCRGNYMRKYGKCILYKGPSIINNSSFSYLKTPAPLVDLLIYCSKSWLVEQALVTWVLFWASSIIWYIVVLPVQWQTLVPNAWQPH